MLLNRIIFGSLAIILGILALKYNFRLTNNLGRMDFLDNIVGTGRTYIVYKLLAVLLVFGGILYLTGFGPAIMEWLLSPLRSLFPIQA